MDAKRGASTLKVRRNPIVNHITFAHSELGDNARTGWRKPISMSGQGKAAWASYSAGGLVFCAGLARKPPISADLSQSRYRYPRGMQAWFKKYDVLANRIALQTAVRDLRNYLRPTGLNVVEVTAREHTTRA